MAVIGTGYVGLVAGACFADLGNDVVCVDIDAEKIKLLEEGKIPIYEPGLDDVVIRNHQAKRLTFTTSLPDAVKASELIFIAVGTPPGEDGSADLKYVKQVAGQIADSMDSYKIVVNKSTVPVGTAELVKEIIAEKTSHAVDVVSNPEFLREGSALRDFMEPDRVVLGCDNLEAAEIVKKLYEPLNSKILITNAKSSELIKYASNTFLAIKISFINEIANLCEKTGADVEQVAKGMGLDKRIGKHFLNAGAGYGGSCLVGDEYVVVRRGENVFCRELRELYSSFKSGFEVLSFDNKNKKIVFSKVKKMTKREYSGKFLKVKTRMNKSLVTTFDHPFLVLGEEGIKVKLANELSLDDCLIAFSSFPETGLRKNRKIDCISLLGQDKFDFEKIRVRSTGVNLIEIKEQLKPFFGSARLREITRSNCLNLMEFLEIEKTVPLKRDELLLFTVKGNPTYFPAVIEVDSDFCRLLGYYASEGHIHYENCLRGVRARIAFSFNKNEKEFIDDVKSLLEKNSIRFSVFSAQSVTSISVSSRIMAFVFDDVFGLGKDSYTANVPDLVFGLAKECRKEFLKGLFRGDGHIAFPKNTNSAVYDFGSISKKLVDKQVLLFGSISVVPSYKRSISAKSTDFAHFLRVSTKKQIEGLRDFKDMKTQDKVDRVLKNCKDIKPVGFKRIGSDIISVNVKTLESFEGTADVYSMEVENTNSFVTSHGLIVHNCFPKDVKAIIHTAELNNQSMLVAKAAEEVNMKQKIIPAQKTEKLLGSLQGKKVALLGLAFKPDTDDLREASSIEIARYLKEKGAEITAYDPIASDNAKKVIEGINYVSSAFDAVKEADAVILVTEWDEFKEMDLGKVKELMSGNVFVDARNIYNPEHVKKLGFSYTAIGRL